VTSEPTATEDRTAPLVPELTTPTGSGGRSGAHDDELDRLQRALAGEI
jgi:hypothetical protein